MSPAKNFGPGFRKLSRQERRRAFTELLGPDHPDMGFFLNQNPDQDLADLMVENSIGYMEVPLGLVPGFWMNGQEYTLPLATEEPSVIAAASYGARLLSRWGGIQAQAVESQMLAQVFLEQTAPDAKTRLNAAAPELELLAREHLQSMERRGGGLRRLTWKFLAQTRVWEILFQVGVCDAMGANLLNTLAEELTPRLEEITGGRKLLAILSNDGQGRLAQASFKIPLEALSKPGISGPEMGRRLVLASQVAEEEPLRAITHNKGIMNGITALALATGNDTRALEAAAHGYASRSGRVKPLSNYRIEGDSLVGEIELPVSLAAVGGALGFHPTTNLTLDLLGRPDARTLGALGAALGLAQNLAALFALTGEGIQKGHMALHQRRQDYVNKKRGLP